MNLSNLESKSNFVEGYHINFPSTFFFNSYIKENSFSSIYYQYILLFCICYILFNEIGLIFVHIEMNRD